MRLHSFPTRRSSDLARFRPFVNSDEPDLSGAYVRVRGQRQPVELRPARLAPAAIGEETP